MLFGRTAGKAGLILLSAAGLTLSAAIGEFRVGGVVLAAGGVAWADDDGDDGDDGGGRSSRGGWDGDDDDDRRAGPGINLRSLFRKIERNTRRTERRQQRPQRQAARATPQFAAGELVALGLDADALGRLNQAGFVTLEQSRLGTFDADITRLRIPPQRSLDQARADVLAIAPAATVDRNHYYQPDAAEACLSSDCPARDLIGWSAPATGAAACNGRPRIGMIDTGINEAHQAFEGSDIEVVRLSREGAQASASQHGTAVAALLVGARESRTPGLVPGAGLIAVDTFHRGAGGDLSDVYSLLRGLDLLATRDLPVINMSLSGPANPLLERAVRQLANQGTVLVAAAGNEGHRAAPVYPAAYAEVVAVTAVDRRKRVYRRAGRGAHIDLAAPGVEVWTAASISGARTKTGTSFAAPFVTAAIALALRTEDAAPSRQVAVERLTGSAEDLGEPGHDPVFGWGLLNPANLCRS